MNKTQKQKNQFIIGVDAGGTKVRAVLMQGEKVLKRSEKLHIAGIVTKEIFLQTVFGVINEIWDDRAEKIGLGAPGPVENNRFRAGGRVKSLDKIDFQKILEKKYRKPVVLENDAKAMLLFEAQKYPQYNSIFMITLGTGVGGGWIKNSQLIRGSFGSAFEVGQMIVDAKNPQAFEENLSGRGFFKKLGLLPIDSETSARSGNRYHQNLWQEFGRNLGLCLSNISNLIEPEAYILGGGIVKAWPLFIKETQKTLKKYILSPQAKKKTKILKAKDDRWAGAIGAAMIAKS